MTRTRHFARKSLLLTATMLAFPLIAAAPRPAMAQIGISIQIAPPPLPVYEQPPIPDVGYLWTPGYWAYADAGYYWVPGTWVEPPQVGVLWTPPYWGWLGGRYEFHGGYWGATVGFYGGVNYGFGYGGFGYEGGRWEGGRFAYNSSVNNFGGVHVTNVYNRTVNVNNSTHTSFNGGPGGIAAQPTAAERAAASERHIPPTGAQTSHVETAAHTPGLAAKENGGHPAIAATSRPGDFAHAAAAAHPAERTAPHPEARTAEHPEARTAEHPEAHTEHSATEAPHAAAHTATHHTATAHAAPHHTAAPHPVAHEETEHRAAPEHEAAPRPAPEHEAPRAAPREAPHVAPREAPHAAPREAPHPQAHAAPAEHHEEKPRK
jgi:hypothetical protein